MFTTNGRRIAIAIFSAQLVACTQLTPMAPTAYRISPSLRLNALPPPFSYRLIHNFGDGTDGDTPLADLVALNGKLYGTTEYGGKGGNGTIFRIGVGGSETVLHSFGKLPDGELPVAGLIAVSKGATLYGTTESGGKYDLGTVFEVSTSGSTTGKEHVLYSFKGGYDGAKPMGSLIALTRGKAIELFGTTSEGGRYNVNSQTYGLGTVFKVTISGSTATEKVLHSFGSPGDGAVPKGGLVAKGNEFYGATSAGGDTDNGAIYKVSVTGTEKALQYFECSNGRDPVAALTKLGGALYGTTEQGGIECTSSAPKGGYGSVFNFGTGDTLRAVYNFGASPDGEFPLGNLTLDRGKFYTTTSAGGTNGNGTILTVSPGGREKVLYSFGPEPDGSRPAAAPVRMGIFFYGTTSAGGKYGGGVVYAFTH
jgi:uncharacterized repeat protein (TIGR03803 family)